MDPVPPLPRGALFGPLPTRGIWTALDLTRAQFFAILGLAVLLFVFVGGPLWTHAHASHFWRISVSYAVIPVAVSVILYRNGKTQLTAMIVASIVISFIKLVLTAALLILIGVAQS